MITKEQSEFLKVGYFNLHGIRTLRHIDRTWGNDNGEEISTDYIAIISENRTNFKGHVVGKTYYEVYFSNEYHDCGSGYGSATTGYLTDCKKVDQVVDIHYKCILPPENMIVRFLFNEENEYISGEGWDMELVIKPGSPILSCSGDGGDYYYPCGSTNFDDEFFEKTERYPDKLPVYILVGDSGLGKSYIGNKLDNYTETDSWDPEELPENLSCNIVIKGNKYDYSIDQIKELYKPFIDQIDFIIINFSKDD